MRTLRFALAFVVTMAVASFIVAAPPAAANEGVVLSCFPHGETDELVYDNTWGASRSGGRGHKGTDIMSPKGVEVRAVADGVVETLKSGPRSGYYVRLVHDGGWESWYMHLNNDTPGTDDGRGGEATAYAAGLSVGDVVRAGQVIGYVGDSGNAEWTGSHTHFELHIDGQATNPYPYLVAVEEQSTKLLEIAGSLAGLPPHELEIAASGTLWRMLVAGGGVECLPDRYQDLIEHLFGELPGRSVLTTRVVAR